MRGLMAIGALLCLPGFVRADPERVLRDLLTAPARAEQFAPAFLQAVPLAEVSALLSDLRDTIGHVTDVQVSGTQGQVRTDSHELQAEIALDDKGRVAGLFLHPPVAVGLTVTEAVQALAGMAPQSAVLVQRDGQVLAAHNPDLPMHVGSAFKLGVLAVLIEDIAAGQRDWADVIRLEAHHLSLPSGQLQRMPVGAPFTLHTLAAVMIADSDNTATDVLINTLDRDRVAAALGLDDLLTTREYFALKARGADRYLAAQGAEKRDIARKAARALPDLSQVAGAPPERLGWYVPATQLCALMRRVADTSLMAIDPGPVPQGDWDRIAYKGGNDAGVLNLTAQVAQNGRAPYCVTVTLRGDDTASADVATAFGALLKALNN